MRPALVFILYAAVAYLVAGPAFRSPPRDDFPFSNYPMFSERKDPGVTIQQVVALSEHGRRIVLPPTFVANEEVMQAAATIRRAMSAGPAGLQNLCTEIAARVKQSDQADLQGATEVLILSQRFHAVKYFSESRQPEREETLVQCGVSR